MGVGVGEDLMSLGRLIAEALGLTLIVYLLHEKMGRQQRRRRRNKKKSSGVTDEVVGAAEDITEEEESLPLLVTVPTDDVSNQQVLELSGRGRLGEEKIEEAAKEKLCKECDAAAAATDLGINSLGQTADTEGSTIRPCQDDADDRFSKEANSALSEEILDGEEAAGLEVLTSSHQQSKGQFPAALEQEKREIMNGSVSDEQSKIFNDNEICGQERKRRNGPECCKVVKGKNDECKNGKIVQHMEESLLKVQAVDLQRALEVAEDKLKLAKFDLMKERSKTELLRLELESQSEILGIKTSQLAEELNECRQELERTKQDAALRIDLFQKAVDGLQEALHDREVSLKESEDSNEALRKDLLELVTRVGQERHAMEKAIKEERTKAHKTQTQVTEKIMMCDRLQASLEKAEEKLDKKGREKRRLEKELGKLKREAEELGRHGSRGMMVARMLDHIDNID